MATQRKNAAFLADRTTLQAILQVFADAITAGSQTGITATVDPDSQTISFTVTAAGADVNVTGATLSAGILTLTQDDGGPSVQVDLNSFATDAEVTSAISTALTAHNVTADPHPGYLTQTEGDGRYPRTINGQAPDGSGNVVVAVSAGSAAPVAISSATTLIAAHDGAGLHCTSTPALTINSGLGATFGCAIYGAFTYGGTATVTDLRMTGATNPVCALVPTPTLNAYKLVGSKA